MSRDFGNIKVVLSTGRSNERERLLPLLIPGSASRQRGVERGGVLSRGIVLARAPLRLEEERRGANGE